MGDQQGLWASPFRLLLYLSHPAWLILLAAPQPPWVYKSAKQGSIVLSTVSHLTWGHREALCQGMRSCQQLTRGRARPWDCRPCLLPTLAPASLPKGNWDSTISCTLRCLQLGEVLQLLHRGRLWCRCGCCVLALPSCSWGHSFFLWVVLLCSLC